jgi:transposase InsO family protein
VAANVLQRDFTAIQPSQKWAGDITYIQTREGWLYVEVLLDVYSRRVVGWAMATRVTTELTTTALTMALQQPPISVGLLHHSDRGSPIRGRGLSAAATGAWHPMFDESP